MNMEKEYINRWEKPLVNEGFLDKNFSEDDGNITYKVKLTKLRSNHDFLRSDIIVGRTDKLPEVGSRFFMIAEPLVTGFPMAQRLIETTPIKNVERIGKEFQFSTANSTYKLEILSKSPSGSSLSN